MRACPQVLVVAGTQLLGWGCKALFSLPLLRSLTGVKPIVLCRPEEDCKGAHPIRS